MTQYTLGFAFDDLGRVALIHKLRPQCQAGKYNGIGGKLESGESPRHGISREFHEETGILIGSPLWQRRGTMSGQAGFTVYVFTVQSPLVRDVRTTSDEEVILKLPLQLNRGDCLDNVLALIELCRLGVSSPSNVIPQFTLNYN